MIDDKDYLDHIEDLTGSSTFCSAKWENSTIWLGSGQSTSCHHPPAHAIDLEEIKTNPSAIHNTEQKKDDRRLMLQSERPKGCDYCWKLEDQGSVSDRVYKTKIYTDDAIQKAADTKYFEDVNLKTLEISFDRTCNFACSYCNPAFSTTWAKDIKDNGPYENLKSDGRNHFTHAHEASQLFKVGEQNPYVNAFMKWWDAGLKSSLQEIRITGGEPLMSQEFWRFIEGYSKVTSFESDPTHGDDMDLSALLPPRLAVNTNLGCSQELFERFLAITHDVSEMDVYTSCEATFHQAEYIRDGLDFDEWLSRVDVLLFEARIQTLHVMCTINSLSLFSLTEFLDMLLMLKAKNHGGPSAQLSFTLNILRFPSFQSCLVLPEYIRKQRRQDLQLWLWKNATNKYFEQHELNHVERLIQYLKEPEPDDIDVLRHDFKQFYTQYDKRRGKSFEDTFPKEIVEWYRTL